jgi:hypothetical protein
MNKTEDRKGKNALLLTGGLRDGGSNPADRAVLNCNFLPRRKFSGSRHLVKPLNVVRQSGRQCCTFWKSRKTKKYLTISLLKTFSCFCGYKQEKSVSLQIDK